MASLRARLIAALLAMAAAGLVVLGAVTYLEQRSFLLERVDQQAEAAPGAIGRILDTRGVPGGPPDRDGDGDRRGLGPGDLPAPAGPAGQPGRGLPPGTYGQRRDASGRVLGEAVISYGQAVRCRPDLPRDLPPGRLLTVPGRGGPDNDGRSGDRREGHRSRCGDGARYRVFAEANPRASGLTVAAIPLADVEETLARLLLVEALVIGGVLLGLAGLAWTVVRIGLLPLDRIGHTAGAIAGGDLSRRVESTDPRTEVGRLGLALNGMLDRLEQAFSERQASEDRLRQFIADASHELRTPLASIRGYAELFRMGATREPAEVARAMRRIEDEAARMGVLVEDLLTLARLDQVPEAARAEVDLSALVADAVDDARATAPDRAIDSRSEGHAVVLGDAHALRQVLANLLRNALVHTPAGTPIEVSVARQRERVRLEVRDHGPGLPTDDPKTLFERFWRSEGGRERGRAGAGLGLAIVAGIVAAHGGRVEACNARDGGAVFVVDLPALGSAADRSAALPDRRFSAEAQRPSA